MSYLKISTKLFLGKLKLLKNKNIILQKYYENKE